MTNLIFDNGSIDSDAMDEMRARICAARLVPAAAGSMHNGTGPIDLQLPLPRLVRNDDKNGIGAQGVYLGFVEGSL